MVLDMTVSFKAAQFPKSVILYALFFYLRYPVSYRDLQEILAERGVSVVHATLNRWVVRYSPQIAAQAQMRKQLTSSSRFG
jgi:putative transposase